jgi:hypothetical protein
LRISKTSEQCKRSDDEDAKYIVPKMYLTYSLRDEEDKEEVINVIPSTGTIRKSNRTKNPPSAKLDDFLWSKIRMMSNNSNENVTQFTTNPKNVTQFTTNPKNVTQFTTNPKHNQINFYKNSAKNNNLIFIDSDNNQVLRTYHQNICILGSKTNDLLISLYPNLPHILCLNEHHFRQFQIQHITTDDYILGAEFSRRSFHKVGGLYVYTKTFSIFCN